MRLTLLVLFVIAVFSTNILADEREYKELSSDYPLRFVGEVPGANQALTYQLDIFDNRTYFLRVQSLKDGVLSNSNDDIGRWYADKDNRLVLNGAKTKVTYFFILEENIIELMDLKGNRIESKLNYALKESKKAKPLEPKLLMSGVYSYMADAATLYECSTGLRFPVAFEADNIALEKAYLSERIDPGQSLKVNLNVRVADRKEDTGMKPTIIVEKFLEIIPKEKCQNAYSKAKLKNTYWKLTRLNSKPLSLSKSKRREAYMILSSHGKIKGNSGCNNFNGAYELEENKLSLPKPMMMTRMFCNAGVEQEFMKALGSMSSYQIKGEYLEIYDKDGVNSARFESVYLY